MLLAAVASSGLSSCACIPAARDESYKKQKSQNNYAILMCVSMASYAVALLVHALLAANCLTTPDPELKASSGLYNMLADPAGTPAQLWGDDIA